MTAWHPLHHSGGDPKAGQVSQEFTVATGAPQRRVARACAALALAGTGVLVAGPAWAVSTPTPVVPGTSVDAPVAETAPAEAPSTAPSIGSWIIGGTLLEGAAGKPAAQPARKPVTPAAPRAGSGSGRAPAYRPPTASGVASSTATGSGAATAPDGATALPFTGGPVRALVPTGLALLLGGIALTVCGRPRTRCP
jgi:hypothetical protein